MTDQELHVIFGTGPVGQALARELTEGGKAIKMINRSGKQPDGVPNGVIVVAGDVFDANAACELAEGAAVVYQCTNAPYDKWPEQFPRLQANTLAAAAKTGAKYVVAENVYMYGDTHGQPLREDLPYNAHTRKGKVRAQMTEALMNAHRSGKVRAAIARASDFYGPGVLASASGDRMFGFAVEGKAADVVGNPDVLHTYTYIQDFGKTLAILGERAEALGQVWHVPNAETVITRQFVSMIYEELGQPVKIRALSQLMMRMVGLFNLGARESVEMMYEFERPFVVDSSKFTRTFGLQGTPIRVGIKDTVAWYKTHFKPR